MAARRPRVLANSDATEKERAEAAARRKDGTKPIVVERQPYRPKLILVYEEPEYFPEDDGHEILFKESGRSLCQAATELPRRDDIIEFGPDKQEELNKSLQWADCPKAARPLVLALVKKYWDVFDSDGMKRSILGFQAFIDTGTHKPVCCPLPKYGPHESKVMTQLVNALEKNGLVEDDDGPWGALIVLAAKPHQGHKHWTEYIW